MKSAVPADHLLAYKDASFEGSPLPVLLSELGPVLRVQAIFNFFDGEIPLRELSNIIPIGNELFYLMQCAGFTLDSIEMLAVSEDC